MSKHINTYLNSNRIATLNFASFLSRGLYVSLVFACALLFSTAFTQSVIAQKTDANGKPIRNDGPGQPVNAMRGRFRVTLNGFKVNRQTNQGLLSPWDAVTFHPAWQMVNAAGEQPSSRPHRQATSTIGSVPENRVQGGTATTRGGLKTGDGFPTQTPWQRTAPINGHHGPATIPPTVYFEGEIIQHTNAAYLIPTIWVANGPSDMDFVGSYQWQINHDLPALGRAVANIIRGPQPLRLESYLRPGDSMGLRISLRLALGVPQKRPIGLQPERDQFGFIPQVLVLTYDSAEFMSRTDFGKGIGVVPVRYVDPESFAGDYTLYFQVERMRN